MVYARTVADTTLTFIVSGKLWRNSLIMQDLETESLWSHVTGLCLEGEHEGRQLATIPSVQTTWSQWKTAHPDTRVLAKDEDIRSSRYEAYFADPDKIGIFRAQWLMERLPGKELIHGVMVGPHALAVTDAMLVAGQPLTVEVGGVAVTLERGDDGGVRAVNGDNGAEITVLASYWFAWSGFHPNTLVVD